MIKRLAWFWTLAALLFGMPASAQSSRAEEEAWSRQMEALRSSLHPVTGKVAIADAKATLDLGKSYYFLPASEARRVIIEGWGNHPDDAKDVLGLVFPTGKTFLDDTWGAVITYEAMGYVSDDDAHSANYDQLLADMRSGEAEINSERVKQGYPAVELVGWAQPPLYDRASHSMVWARNLRFGGTSENTLNYDVRLLGRHGVLSLNMVSSLSKLDDTRTAASLFARSASFDAGARYADYQPGVDKDSGMGLAGLVAAGTGVAVAKKLGLLGLILAFGKKFIVLIIAAGVGLAGWLRRRLLGRDLDNSN